MVGEAKTMEKYWGTVSLTAARAKIYSSQKKKLEASNLLLFSLQRKQPAKWSTMEKLGSCARANERQSLN
jgi:hypothetical protein